MGFNLRQLLDDVVHPGQQPQAKQSPAQTPPPNQHPNIIQRAAAQVNPFDNGRTFSNPTPTNRGSVLHQLTHNGATNAVGDVVKGAAGFAGIPAVTDEVRATAAELTHNQPAFEHATGDLAGDIQRFAPIAIPEAVMPFAQDVATAVTAPAAEHSAQKEADYARQVLNNNSGDPVHDAQVEAYANAVQNNLLNQQLETAGVDQNTPLSTVARKVVGNATSAGANIAMADSIPALKGLSAPKSAAVFGGLNAASSVGAVAGSDNPDAGDYIKAGLEGAASGALLPLAGHALIEGTPKLVQYAKDNADVVNKTMDVINQNPRPTKLSDQQLVTVSKYRQQMGKGNTMDDATYQGARNALAKEGIDHTDPTAIDNLLGAHRTYTSRKQALQAGFVGKGEELPAKVPKIIQAADKKSATPKPRAPISTDATASKASAKDAALLKQVKGARATPEEQQVIDAVKTSIKSGDFEGAKALAESLPNKHSAPLLAQIKNKGIVDTRLSKIQTSKKAIVKAATDEIVQEQKAKPDILKQVRQAGGISKSDYESVPSSIKNKNGIPMDEMAANLGFKSDAELHDAIQEANATKPLTGKDAKKVATDQLEAGKSSYSNDFKATTAAEKARIDELSLYPKGTRKQVKVLDKAQPMSDAELASLSATAEGKIKATSKKIVPRDDKTSVRNADAERSVLDGLQKGVHTDTVINKYMDDTGTTLQTAVKDINRVADEAGLKTDLGKNPLQGTLKLPKVQAGDWKQATLNSRFVQYKEQEVGSHALQNYRSLTPHDQVLLKDIETNTVSKVSEKADNPAAFKAAEQSIRTYYDTRHAYDRTLGIDVGYRTNYLRQLFDRVEEDNQPVSDQISVSGANKRPGYTKQRTVDTLGTDVGNALEKDITGASFNHAKLAYENGLNEAFPGKIANGEIVRDKESGTYQQLNHPFGGDLSAPKDIAHEINSRTWHKNDSKALNVYDSINRGLKYVKLSGGLFHAFTESGNFIGQQAASGKLFTNPTATGRMFKVFFSPKAMDGELARMADSGVLDKAHLGGLTIRSDQILADANVGALDKSKGNAHKVATYTGVQAMHDATFQREIPYAKLKIFEQKTDGLDPNKPADLTKIRQQAASINNLFGGINREIHGIKPGTFKWLQRGLLATDFTEGKFATLFKAASDKGPAGTTARQAVAGKALLFGLIATAGAGAGGEFNGDSKGQAAKNAAGNLVDPTFEIGGYKVGLPKTHISEVVDALKPTQKTTGKAWNASGLVSYAQNRSAALPSEVISLLNNKNYYGQPLYGTNTKKNGGGPISAPKTALNISQTVLPIPFGQVTDTISGKQNPVAAAANVIGFKAKPNSANSVTLDGVNTTLTDPQRREYDTLTKQNNSSGVVNQLKNSSAYKNASPNDQAKALSELKTNLTDITNRQFAAKNNLGQYAPDYNGKATTATAKQQDVQAGKINPDAYFKSSNNGDSYAVDQFKKSSAKTAQIGDKTYYKAGDGTVKNKSTFDFQNDTISSKLAFDLDRSKANDDYSSWNDAANKKLDQLQAMIGHYDPDTEANKVTDIQKQAADLVDQMQTYASYGGQFTKPAKAKKAGTSSNGITYKFFNPNSYSKTLRDLVKAAKVA